jgi:hypothetical protein
MAKDWVVSPDARFQSENGGIEIGLGVIDSGAQSWGSEKSRRRARVEVMSRTGGIKVDLVSVLFYTTSPEAHDRSKFRQIDSST